MVVGCYPDHRGTETLPKEDHQYADSLCPARYARAPLLFAAGEFQTLTADQKVRLFLFVPQ